MQPSSSLAPAVPDRGGSRWWPEGFRAIVGKSAAAGTLFSPLKSSWQQYTAAVGTFVAVTVLCFQLQNWIGYQAIALVYLLAVVLLAVFVSRGPTVLGTVLTAVGWNYFFAPPAFAFNISDTYDNMMLLTYFVVTLTVGQLTTRLRAQRDAELRARVVEESERLGRTLLNSVSHELRTPIAAITSASGSLRTAGSLSAGQQNLLGEIESASERLNRLVQSLLSAARLQAGHIRPNLDWCDIADLIQVALRGVQTLLRDHPVDTRIGEGLPLVKADFVLLEQALANLMLNAALHTPPGTPIEICARVEPGSLVMEIADRGRGLPPDQLDRVFEPFHRTPAAVPGGTGLGLTIVKGFVEAQGGRIQATNRDGGGARFIITLPLSDPPSLPRETS